MNNTPIAMRTAPWLQIPMCQGEPPFSAAATRRFVRPLLLYLYTAISFSRGKIFNQKSLCSSVHVCGYFPPPSCLRVFVVPYLPFSAAATRRCAGGL